MQKNASRTFSKLYIRKKIHVLILLFTCFVFSCSKESDNSRIFHSEAIISIADILDLDIPQYPSIHLFDKDNNLIFSHFGLTSLENLKYGLQTSHPLSRSVKPEKISQFVRSRLRNENGSKKLVFLTLDESFSDCPPCRKLETVIEALSKDDISKHILIKMKVGN